MAEAAEAILNQSDDAGNLLVSGALSKTEVEVLDLLGEGEIEGLVSGEYLLLGNTGEIGYRSATFSYFPAPSGDNTLSFLRSVYWNQVPLINTNGRYNFQKIDISATNGFPNGAVLSNKNPELTITRTLGERLIGTEFDANNIPLDSKDFTKIYRILNPSCKAAIINVKIGQLFRSLTQDEGTNKLGDIVTTTVDYNIYYRPIYSKPGKTPNVYTFGKHETIEGKVNAGYIRSSRVDFFKSSNPTDVNDFIGWEIKIFRTTPESIANVLRNQTVIDSLTEIYSDIFTYPNSAIVRQRFDAQFFNQVPDRAFDCNLLKVKIPSNYNPILRTYTESDQGWDGTFADNKKWSNNPAWCFYDLITNQRYGLGRYIDETAIDKWSLYQISKYCDTLVEDGQGGIEPLFTCNLIFNSRDEAYKVLNDMASIFNAMLYYANGIIYPVQDSAKNALVQFTNANVENGDFHYSTSSRRVRHTVSIVRFNDKTDFYKPAVEYVEDIDGIRKYGIRELDLTAFGCTSRGQANRLGKWALLTETLENETVSFIAGTEAIYLRPGDIFKVFDSNRKTQRLGGRTYQIANTNNSCSVTLDNQISLSTGTFYDISFLTPSYNLVPNSTGITTFRPISKHTDGADNITSSDFPDFRKSFLQTLTFQGISGSGIDSNNRTVLNIPSRLDDINYNLSGNVIWTITLNTGVNNYADSRQFLDSGSDYYRVLRVEEKDSNRFNVTALQYAAQKYQSIITGLNIKRPKRSLTQANYSQVQLEGMAGPTGLRLTLNNYTLYTPRIDYSFSVPSYTNITSYRTYAKTQDFPDLGVPNDIYLVDNLPVDKTFNTYTPNASGQYYFRVYSYNDNVSLISTSYASGNINVNTFSPIQDVSISSLQLDAFVTGNAAGTTQTGFYYNESPVFTWQVGVNSVSAMKNPFTYRVSIRQPSNSNTPSNIIYYQESGLDLDTSNTKYTFTLAKNIAGSGGPYRNYDIVVEAMDNFNNTSAGNSLAPLSEVWTNPNGYDILAVQNNKVTGFYLSTGDNLTTSGYLTNEWMDGNGNIYINFLSGSISTGIRGGYVFYSTGQFNSNEVTGTNRMIVKTGEFDYDFKNNLAKIPTQFYGIRTGYIALSFYDTFDNALKLRGNDPVSIVSGLYSSNVISITATGNLDILGITNSIQIRSSEGSNLPFHNIKMVRSGTFLVLKSSDDLGNEYVISSKSA